MCKDDWIYGVLDVYVFFFKQKTAYELLRSLVGSEMCIRDSPQRALGARGKAELEP